MHAADTWQFPNNVYEWLIFRSGSNTSDSEYNTIGNLVRGTTIDKDCTTSIRGKDKKKWWIMYLSSTESFLDVGFYQLKFYIQG